MPRAFDHMVLPHTKEMLHSKGVPHRFLVVWRFSTQLLCGWSTMCIFKRMLLPTQHFCDVGEHHTLLLSHGGPPHGVYFREENMALATDFWKFRFVRAFLEELACEVFCHSFYQNRFYFWNSLKRSVSRHLRQSCLVRVVSSLCNLGS